MDQLLQHLKSLGFTEMESKVMVHLSSEGASEGFVYYGPVIQEVQHFALFSVSPR